MQTQTSNSISLFCKGDHVEVIEPNRNAFYPASVLRAQAKQENHVFVQYKTLFNSALLEDGYSSKLRKRLRECISVANVRPKLTRELHQCFKVGDHVDAYRDNAWYPGTVTDILENSRFLVAFEGSKKEIVAIEKCSLRLHRKWVDGSWMTPFPEKEEKPPEMERESENMRLKIKCSRKPLEVSCNEECHEATQFIASTVDSKPPEMETKSENKRFKIKYKRKLRDSKFKMGTMVEVSSNEGHNGARFIATPVDSEKPPEMETQFENMRFKIKYSRKPRDSKFKKGTMVKACGNEGREVEQFIATLVDSVKSNELANISRKVMTKTKGTGNKLIMKYQKFSELAKKSEDVLLKTMGTGNKFVPRFCEGGKVEVRSDEEGYEGAWYTAIVVGIMKNGKYLVEYQTLKTEDLTENLREEADVLDIRPLPPDINHIHLFSRRERVDVWYNDGWWVGEVSDVIHDFEYKVYFQTTKEEMVFTQCNLRPHQEWINGKWVVASWG